MTTTIRKLFWALDTTMPCCCTAGGKRGIACWTLFWTWTCAVSGLVPCLNVTPMLAAPAELDELEK